MEKEDNLELSEKEMNELIGIVLIELTNQEKVSLFHSLENHIKFYCSDEILTEDYSLETLVSNTPHYDFLKALKSIRPDLSARINQLFFKNNFDI